MPVWHERTRAARESGRLKVVGLIQEQHPERRRLWARWQGVDWPIQAPLAESQTNGAD